MIVALLVLIALILLFGSGLVLGWLRGGILMALMIAAIAATLIWLSSFLTRQGLIYALLAAAVLITAASVWVRVHDAPADPHQPRRP